MTLYHKVIKYNTLNTNYIGNYKIYGNLIVRIIINKVLIYR